MTYERDWGDRRLLRLRDSEGDRVARGAWRGRERDGTGGRGVAVGEVVFVYVVVIVVWVDEETGVDRRGLRRVVECRGHGELSGRRKVVATGGYD